MDWSAWSAVLASFLASLVEVVEAFTIVLVASVVRGWRPALLGALAALACLALLVLALGPLIQFAPRRALQLVIGVLLLLFGLRWLRKAILRALGRIALHDEDAAFAKESGALTGEIAAHPATADWIAGLAAFKAVTLEGVEVVFIVIAVGAGHGAAESQLWPASLGAAFACLLVLAIGALVHRPLSRVPENALKLVVGVMLSALGVFWTAEGLGGDWPGGDAALPALVATFAILSLGTVRLLGARAPAARSPT